MDKNDRVPDPETVQPSQFRDIHGYVRFSLRIVGILFAATIAAIAIILFL